MELLFLLAIIGFFILGARITFEISEKNKWERNKFFVSQVEKFISKSNTKIVHTLLESNGAEIQLNGDSVDVDEDDLYECFLTDDYKSYFLPQQVDLRGIFNEYFDDLTKLTILHKANLVDKEMFKLLLGRWLNKISGTRHGGENKRLYRQMHEYLFYYGYNELMDFIIKYRDDKYRQLSAK